MTPLEVLVRDRMHEQGWSAYRVCHNAATAGHGLSPNTIHRMLQGEGRRPRRETLEALAAGLQVPYEHLRRVTTVPPDLGEWEPPACARFLSVNDRALVESLIRRLAAHRFR